MKLNDNMRYPHPVLSEYSADYVTGQFSCEFTQQMTSDGELKLISNLELDSGELKNLINEQKASVGYFIVCRRTYFNFLQEAPLSKSEKYFDASKLFGTVIIRPVVWTLSRIENFKSPVIHQEFGEAVTMPKGAVIALGPEFRFSMDRKKFKPFESIFELGQRDDIEPGIILVDPMQDRITILAEPQTYKSLADMRNLNKGRDVLLNAVYMPAVMDVVTCMQAGGADLAGKNWYRIFKGKCDDLGIDPSNINESPLEIAQKLLKAPLKRTIMAIGSM